MSSVLAATPETNARIRLDALANKFFEPLSLLLGQKRYMVSNTQFSSLDCLALGYLSLMLKPDLPQPWLAVAMRKRFPGLCNWTEGLGQEIFGGLVTLEDACLKTRPAIMRDTKDVQETQGSGPLPWVAPQNTGVLSVGGTFLSSITDSLPLVGQLRRTSRFRHLGNNTTDDDTQSDLWQNVTIFGSLVAGLGLAAGYAIYTGIFSSGATQELKMERSSPGLYDLGEAGAALSVLANQMDLNAHNEYAAGRNSSHGEPVVEVDLDVDRGRIKTTESVS